MLINPPSTGTATFSKWQTELFCTETYWGRAPSYTTYPPTLNSKMIQSRKRPTCSPRTKRGRKRQINSPNSTSYWDLRTTRLTLIQTTKVMRPSLPTREGVIASPLLKVSLRTAATSSRRIKRRNRCRSSRLKSKRLSKSALLYLRESMARPL